MTDVVGFRLVPAPFEKTWIPAFAGMSAPVKAA